MAMKLGADTGSALNHIMSRQTKGQPKPEVGMGATILSWSDRHAATIISVLDRGKTMVVEVQHDNAVLTSGTMLSENQSYTYHPDPTGLIEYFRKDAKGGWHPVQKNPDTGRWKKSGSTGLKIGVREQYRDPSF